MKKYRLYALSRYAHQEGYLDLALRDLVLSLPSNGNGFFLQTIHDKNDNPYLIINFEDAELLEENLMQRIIMPEASEYGTFEYLEKIIEKCDIHKAIQENEGDQRKFTRLFN